MVNEAFWVPTNLSIMPWRSISYGKRSFFGVLVTKHLWGQKSKYWLFFSFFVGRIFLVIFVIFNKKAKKKEKKSQFSK